ncbi:C-type lectin domain family 11 member A [Protopterus annectens]|uniref:C-type lectin domain family 11 member A n=1 Tax=Protopterus annectens TaxID=7888 RepID=UPI001CF93EBE|nr:C-type lectin domain family 11 member A [Protopterus annectens]
MILTRLLFLVLCGILLSHTFASDQLSEEIPLTENEAQSEKRATEENETDPSPKEEKIIPIQVPPKEVHPADKDKKYFPTTVPSSMLMTEANGNFTEEEKEEEKAPPEEQEVEEEATSQHEEEITSPHEEEATSWHEEEATTWHEEEGVSTLPDQIAPTTALDDFSYIFNRLSELDMALYRLNLRYHDLEYKTSQNMVKLQDKLNRVLDSMEQHSARTTKNQREIGRIAGCLKGKRVGRKCFHVFHQFETYDTAQNFCHNSGGNLAMPKTEEEYAVLARYARDAFYPGNWPIWIGIHDLRDEGLYMYQDGYLVSFFKWYKDFLVSQPNGGKHENCVAISSDDGKWWDNDCARRMYYMCEYEF